MADLGLLDSLADVDMVDVAWVRLVCAQAIGCVHGTNHRAFQPSSRDGCQRNQDLIVAPLLQTVAHANRGSQQSY